MPCKCRGTNRIFAFVSARICLAAILCLVLFESWKNQGLHKVSWKHFDCSCIVFSGSNILVLFPFCSVPWRISTSTLKSDQQKTGNQIFWNTSHYLMESEFRYKHVFIQHFKTDSFSNWISETAKLHLSCMLKEHPRRKQFWKGGCTKAQICLSTDGEFFSLDGEKRTGLEPSRFLFCYQALIPHSNKSLVENVEISVAGQGTWDVSLSRRAADDNVPYFFKVQHLAQDTQVSYEKTCHRRTVQVSYVSM